MGNVLDFAKNFKDMAELQAYAEAQFRSIMDLTKKVTRLEEQNEHLKTKLLSATAKASPTSDLLIPTISDPETICTTQLSKMKDRCLSGDELTLEETKRVEIYTKLLLQIHGKSTETTTEKISGAMTEEQLLNSIKLV